VRALFDSNGVSIEKAIPPMPIRLLGLRSLPNAGQELLAVENESKVSELT